MITAQQAQRLLHDPDFLTIVNSIRAEQINRFTSSTPKEAEIREEAHQIIKALEKIEAALNACIADEAIKRKRKQDAN